MKLLKFTRYSEWWEYKLVPLLSVGYASTVLTDSPIEGAMIRLAILLMAIVVGAIYVSVINDITDIDEDKIAGKFNRIAELSLPWKIFLVTACLVAGVFFSTYIYPDLLSLFFYIMAWIVFTLYSVPPFRLKKRGFWGVICDAAGAHHFPTLLVTANILYIYETDISMIWYLAVGIWSLMYGLRGILWHQFQDRENDKRSGTTTFASGIDPEEFRGRELTIFVIEIISLTIVLYFVYNIWLILGLCCYFLFVYLRRALFKHEITLITTPKSSPYQLLMNDYYLVFLPLSLLISLSLTTNYGWLALVLHILLFPRKIILVLKDFFLTLKTR